MSQATLHTYRIRLVPLSEVHLGHEVDLDSDPEVMRYLGNGRARTRVEVEEQHRRRVATSERVSGLGFWAQVRRRRICWLVGPGAARSRRPGSGRGAGRARLPDPSSPLAQGPGK